MDIVSQDSKSLELISDIDFQLSWKLWELWWGRGWKWDEICKFEKDVVLQVLGTAGSISGIHFQLLWKYRKVGWVEELRIDIYSFKAGK